VAVIAERTARAFGVAPEAIVGQHMRFGTQWREVVGVVADVRTPGLADSLAGLHAYWPLTRHGASMTLLVRAEDGVAAGIRGLLAGYDPDVVVEPAPMNALLQRSLHGTQFLVALFCVLAVLAGLMAVFGVYAVLSHVATAQRGSIAVRMAVGATEADVQRWLVWKCLSTGLAGVAVGAALSYPFGRLLSGHLFGVPADSLAARLLVAALVLAATAIAGWVPSLRASRVPPHGVLKEA
jgi:putative ABC transport system permease protein